MDAANVFRVSSLNVDQRFEWVEDRESLASLNRCRSLLLEAGADPMSSSENLPFISYLLSDGYTV